MINLNGFGMNAYWKALNPPLRKEESFFKKVNCHHTVNEEEIEVALKEQQLTLSPAHEQTQSDFLQTFPIEIQIGVFKYLDLKDLRNCLFVCKQFNHLSNSLLLDEGALTLINDYKNLKIKMIKNLNSFETLSISFPDVIGPNFFDRSAAQKYLDDLTHSNEIPSFKAYCILLIKNTKGGIEKTRAILRSTMKLQKCFHLYLEKQQKAIGGQYQSVFARIYELVFFKGLH